MTKTMKKTKAKKVTKTAKKDKYIWVITNTYNDITLYSSNEPSMAALENAYIKTTGNPPDRGNQIYEMFTVTKAKLGTFK